MTPTLFSKISLLYKLKSFLASTSLLFLKSFLKTAASGWQGKFPVISKNTRFKTFKIHESDILKQVDGVQQLHGGQIFSSENTKCIFYLYYSRNFLLQQVLSTIVA